MYANLSYTLDTIVPTVSITSAPNIINSNYTSYALSGNCSENGRVVTVSVGGVTPGVQPTCTGGAWNVTGLDVSSLTDAPSIAVTANHQDAAGNAATQASINVSKQILIFALAAIGNTVANLDIISTINTGTCNIASVGSIVITSPDVVESPVTCDCAGGLISCPGAFTFNGQDITANLSAAYTLGGQTINDTEDIPLTPYFVLNLQQTGQAVGDPITIGGTCMPDSTGSVNFTSDDGFMVPTSFSCDCASGVIDNCIDPALNPITTFLFTATDTLNATMTVNGVTATASSDFQLIDLIFGFNGGMYWEDGWNGYCLRLSVATMDCTSAYASFNDPTTYMPTGVDIYFTSSIEASVFVFGTDGIVYSGNGTATGPVARAGNEDAILPVTFPASITTLPEFVVGHHNSGCFLHEDGDVSCFGQTNAVEVPVERVDQNAKELYSGHGSACYITFSGDLMCDTHGSGTGDVPLANPTLKATGVEYWTSGTRIVNYNLNRSLVFYEDGSVATSDYKADSLVDLVGFTHTGKKTVCIGENNTEAAWIDQSGQLISLNGNVATAVTAMGSTNLDVELSFDGVGGFRYILLNAGKVYGSADPDNFTTSSSEFGSSLGFNDWIAIKGFKRDFCAVRANLDIYCAGTHAAGGSTFASPIFMGTYV